MLIRYCVERFVKSGRFRAYYDFMSPTRLRIQATGILDVLAGL